MPVPVSVRLDDDVREILEAEAASRGLPPATLLRGLAADAVREVRRARIREASAAVGRHIAASPEAAAFLSELGRPVDDR